MEHSKKSNKRLTIQITMITAGVGALVLGIYFDEVRTILTKAIYICLECIGIG